MSIKKVITALILFIIIIPLLVITYAFCENTNSLSHAKPLGQAIINGKIIYLEISDCPDKIVQGLSDRQSLPEDFGMLFIFPDKQIRTFWMRNMHFPLDIIWLDDNEIVKVSKNLPPESEVPQKIHSSDRAVNYVIEVKAGFVDKYRILNSDKVILKLLEWHQIPTGKCK